MFGLNEVHEINANDKFTISSVREMADSLDITKALVSKIKPRTDEQFSLTSILTSLFSRVYDEQFFRDGRTREQVYWLKSWHDQLFNQAPCQGKLVDF